MNPNKKNYAIYYGDDPRPAKLRADELRKQGHTAVVIDATSFQDKEQVGMIEFADGVRPYDRQRIRDAYEGHIRESDPTVNEQPGRVPVPDNWKSMRWEDMQALAADIAPNEVVRTKDDAKRIIADYITESKTPMDGDTQTPADDKGLNTVTQEGDPATLGTDQDDVNEDDNAEHEDDDSDPAEKQVHDNATKQDEEGKETETSSPRRQRGRKARKGK